MGISLGTLTIPISTKPSNAIGGRQLRTLRSLMVIAPATLTGTITLQVPDGIGSSPTFVNLTRPSGSAGGTEDITIAASKVVTLSDVPMHSIRVNSSDDEGAARAFEFFGEEKV